MDALVRLTAVHSVTLSNTAPIHNEKIPIVSVQLVFR